MIYRRFCKSCGVAFTTSSYIQHCHSIPCQIAWTRVKDKIRKKKYYQKHKHERNAVVFKICIFCHAEYQTLAENPQVVCIDCQLKGKSFTNRHML